MRTSLETSMWSSRLASWQSSNPAAKTRVTFRIDSGGLPECDQLKSGVDDYEDAGTPYGMRSSHVLEDKSGYPGRIYHGHPEVVTENLDGYHARFHSSNVLGRLECACEPRLDLKPYCHAVNAAALPNCLTGRTRNDEAIQYLRKGY